MYPAITSIPYIWILFAGLFTAFIVTVTYLGIRPSLNYTAIAGLMEILFLLIGSIIIIIRVGSGNSLIPFEVTGKYSLGFHPLCLHPCSQYWILRDPELLQQFQRR